MHFLVPKAMPNLVQPLKGHWLKEVFHLKTYSTEGMAPPPHKQGPLNVTEAIEKGLQFNSQAPYTPKEEKKIHSAYKYHCLSGEEHWLFCRGKGSDFQHFYVPHNHP